jgi:Fe-S-cluster-containing dehydrogenase component
MIPEKLYIDSESCVGCGRCIVRCSLEKTGSIRPAESRVRVLKQDDEGVSVPVICRHCEEPTCLPACPVDCMSRDEETGRIVIHTDDCIGCKKCVEACSFAGPVDVPVTGRKVKSVKVICDLCDGRPACVTVCPTGALSFETPNPESAERESRSAVALRQALARLTEEYKPRAARSRDVDHG